MTLVFSALLGFYFVADALSQYSPSAVDRRNATENAAVVAAVREVYAANAWYGMDHGSCPQDPFEDPPATPVQARTVAYDPAQLD